MKINHLITMANQIGSFYETMPDRGTALRDIADHIKKFWDPRMRRELLLHIDQQEKQEENSEDSPQLLPIVLESLEQHRNML